MFAMK